MRQIFNFVPISRRLLQIVWPFLVIVVLMVVMAGFTTGILSSVRAYVGAESLWSKSQKEAVAALNAYARTQAEEDYQRYQVAIAVPQGARRARIELDRPEPNYAVARQGFVDGRNDPEDIDGMITLYRRFRHLNHMQRAIGIWAKADQEIALLEDAAQRLHAKIRRGVHDPSDLRPVLDEINTISARLTPLEEAFSSTLGEASRRAGTLLQVSTIAAALLLGLLGIMLSRRMLRRSIALETALRSSDERFSLAVSGSNDGLWDWNVLTGEFYFSPRCAELVGYADNELGNSSSAFVALLHPDDRDPTRAATSAHLRYNAPFDVEFRCRCKSGEYRWFRARGRSVRNASGWAVRMAGSVTDITDRKQVEAQVYAEKERAQVTLASIADSVITTNVDGRVEYLNPVAETLTGWKMLEARGLPLSTVCSMMDEATRQPVADPVARVLREDATVRVASNVVLLRRDGVEIAIDQSAAPIHDRLGAITGVTLVLHDVRREREFATQLSYQASHDTLTGLINRREFERRLDHALTSAREQGRHHAMMYLDLDQFKVVNDTCGHAAGDEFMRQISVVLQERLREGDTLARLGGDEFGVLLENCQIEHALRIADTLRQSIADFHFVVNQRTFTVGVSVGLVNMADGSLTLTEVLSAGDAACYMAKEKGRNRVQLYHPKDTELALRHGEMEWVGRIQDALTSGRFCLYTQRIVPVDAGQKSTGMFELLVRMIDERGELVPPMAFIPAAERYNLMPQIDRWVTHTALATMAARRIKLRKAETCIINLSGASIGDERFLDFIRTELNKSGAPKGSVCFEVTETAAIANLSKATRFISELKALGCLFSLDDFGSGMSSFGYLKHLPVDFLKIDGSFVRDMLSDPIDNAMVEAINQIGHVMGKRTIAEYVEHEGILERLREIGVDYAQGFGVSMPKAFGVGAGDESAPRVVYVTN
ncbi:MAG TPA: EAL domain-containing protein [Casimicrobiaceae bacterium]|nr:EAL domain-containing protein [Casimicrobiaceae bacterium]